MHRKGCPGLPSSVLGISSFYTLSLNRTLTFFCSYCLTNPRGIVREYIISAMRDKIIPKVGMPLLNRTLISSRVTSLIIIEAVHGKFRRFVVPPTYTNSATPSRSSLYSLLPPTPIQPPPLVPLSNPFSHILFTSSQTYPNKEIFMKKVRKRCFEGADVAKWVDL